ncbi:hypothetical protein ACFO1V_12445 [Daeguia caeni]|uniref:Uncharacterized protein n=1 Tax=Daeguia caeni TaxID=439612 RepID=A0ABV9H810_9HYPH
MHKLTTATFGSIVMPAGTTSILPAKMNSTPLSLDRSNECDLYAYEKCQRYSSAIGRFNRCYAAIYRYCLNSQGWKVD